MSVLKVIEILGNSEKGWEDAAAQAVAHAANSVSHIRSVNIQNQSATVKDGKIHEYRVNVKISFDVKQPVTQYVELESEAKAPPEKIIVEIALVGIEPGGVGLQATAQCEFLDVAVVLVFVEGGVTPYPVECGAVHWVGSPTRRGRGWTAGHNGQADPT